VLRFCDRVADLAREGKLRNAPEEVAGVKLSADDLVALEVFLRALMRIMNVARTDVR
jgi:hypothetical protein